MNPIAISLPDNSCSHWRNLTLIIGGVITIGAGIWFQQQRPILRKYIRPVFVSKDYSGSATEIQRAIKSKLEINKWLK
jgi:hypothetical protein